MNPERKGRQPMRDNTFRLIDLHFGFTSTLIVRTIHSRYDAFGLFTLLQVGFNPYDAPN